MKILLGITGSVATSLTPKFVKMLQERGHEVKIVATDKSFQFLTFNERDALSNICGFYTDEHEFYGKPEYVHPYTYKKNDAIEHIALREWGDVLLISPCSLNTMAKLANGICDNLLTSVFRAWDFEKPVYIAPSGNTKMWLHPVTKSHLNTFKEWGVNVIYPTVKKLACGENGVGALADLNTIINIVEGHRWRMPFDSWVESYLPLPPHPGAFGTNRHHHIHTGTDKYSDFRTAVYAMEDGEIIDKGQFTGEKVGSPWWNDTWFVTVRGKSGTIVYGEIELYDTPKGPYGKLEIGQKIKASHRLGEVLEVVKESPRKYVEGHKKSMLHIELLSHDLKACPEWVIGEDRPKGILDPTPYLYLI